MRTRSRTLLSLSLAILFVGGAVLSAQRGQPNRGNSASRRLSGTYELEMTRGDNAQRAAEQATRSIPSNQRDRAYQSLLGRLQPPGSLAIDRNGQNVTISSSNGPRTTFEADGRNHNESGPGGRRTTTRAQLSGDTLSVSTSGNRSTDFLVTFESIDSGAGLLVTRRMDSDDIRQPVTIRSYYHRVSNDPRWDIYASRDDGGRRAPRPFVIAEGTRIVAVLDTTLSTRTTRLGERFTMTVRSPDAYQGARIDGIVDRITSRGRDRDADMRINFDTIQLRNGQTAEFDAVLSTVRTPGGATFRVSGGAADSGRTGDTVEGTAIGAGLGAIIGAIAGGGKGAAIGALVGGASGAILAQDRDEYLELPPGTLVTIVVTPPRYRTP